MVLVRVSICVGAYDDALGFRVATELLNKGSYLEALAAYQEVVTYSDSYDSKAKELFYMGTIYSLYLDQYDMALKLYRKTMQEYPESRFAADALFNTGMVLYEKREFREAYNCFRSYLDKYPNGSHRESAEVWADSAKAEIDTKSPRVPRAPYRLKIDDTTLRVLINDRVSRLTFDTEGKIIIADPFPRKTTYMDVGPLNVTAQDNQVVVNGTRLGLPEFMVSANEGILGLDGRRYRGSFKVLAQDGNRLQPINYISLEHYLYGVVPREMPHKWPLDALKALAVAARTYALYIKRKEQE